MLVRFAILISDKETQAGQLSVSCRVRRCPRTQPQANSAVGFSGGADQATEVWIPIPVEYETRSRIFPSGVDHFHPVTDVLRRRPPEFAQDSVLILGPPVTTSPDAEHPVLCLGRSTRYPGHDRE